MKIETTRLTDVLILTPDRFSDERGFFSESWNVTRMAEKGIHADFVQDNPSLSLQAGPIRGLHFQAPPFAQGKLVRCGRGALFDIVVDIRQGSPDYGQWTGVELSAANGRQLWIPPGFMHGFVTRTDNTEIIYKCTAHYSPDHDQAIRFNDPDIAIDWGMSNEDALVSARDQTAMLFSDFTSPFHWKAADT